jgi:phosphate transport system substrate-binding protein
MPGWKSLVLTGKSKMATTTQEAVEAVKRVPGAIGFGPYSRSLEDGSVVLAIDGRAPHAAEYPSAVTVSLIYKGSTLDEASSSFLAFAHSEAVRHVLEANGGIPLTR